ncbi:hypothetical protein ACIBBB_01525 [Streptomyces sp. NPDC051217]|uniref:hypothetical protein n=1 Tax=Streptomyces sp. NPDC051217 TaxID=3365644 RepID=UPI0037BC810B
MDPRLFPDGLVRTQRAWTAAYQDLAASSPGDNTVLRRRLLRLSVRLWWHPYLVARPAARSELRARVSRETTG